MALESEWYQDADIAPEYQTYVGLELAASEILNCQSHVVVGLLQTADYARALLSTNRPHRDDLEAYVEASVPVRMRRQEEVLYRPDTPAKLFAVMDESALRRPIGPPDVMAAQVEKLIESSDLPNVVVQVIPITRTGAHPAWTAGSPYYGSPIPRSGHCVRRGLARRALPQPGSDVVRYVEIFDYLAEVVAESPADSLRTLHQLRKYWQSSPS